MRMAMGATRGRIVRKVLTESALLAMIGAAGGLLIAWIATPLLARAFPPVRDFTTERLALSVQFGIDWRLLIFSTVVSGMCVLLAGAAPAIHAARMNGDTVLRGARSSSGWGSRQGLLVFQIALCTALLAGAGLLTRTLAQLQAVDPGFDRDHIVTFTANPGLASYRPAQAEALRVALLDRVRNLTGIRSVALADRPLMRGSGIKMTIAPMGDRITDQDFLNTSTNTVSPEYFLTMGMRIVDGRNFTAEDARRKEAPQPVVVNEAFVRRFFPRTEAVGKRFGGGRVGPAKGDYEILGVASDAKYRSLREPMTPTMYRPWIGGAETFQLVVRTDGRPESVIDPVRRTLASLDPALPFTEIETMQDEISASTAPERSTAILASMIAIAAAVLAGIGIYGLLAYMVAERRREIGIRMALGARAAHVGKMFAIQSGWMGLNRAGGPGFAGERGRLRHRGDGRGDRHPGFSRHPDRSGNRIETGELRMLRGITIFMCAASAFGQAKFEAHEIATGLRGGYQVVVADMNHDGKPDLIALASGLTELAWYENPRWQKHVIVSGIRQPINLAVVDEQKGILALAHEFSPNAQRSIGTVSILEAQGDPTQPFKRTDIDKLPASHRLRMMNGLLINAPLTDAQATAPDYHGKTPLVYYKPGDWKRQLITDEDDGVLHCIYPYDWDGKGKQDLLTASMQGVFLIRMKADGTWSRTKLTGGDPDAWPKGGASDVAVGHIGKERYLATIEPWHGNIVAVYHDRGGKWERSVIDDTLVDGHVLLTGDLDGNKRDVIIASYRGKGSSVNLYRFDGKQWNKSLLDEGGMAGAGCAVADLNGDGRLDVACIGTSTANLKWYENLGTK